MSYKKIVFTKPKVTEIQDYEITEPNSDEVQVRLAVSSISSGTERANILGDVNISVFEKMMLRSFLDLVDTVRRGLLKK